MRRTPFAVTAAAAALLALTACGGPGDDPEPETDPSADASTEPSAAADPTDPACLIGDWRITQDQIQVFYDAVSASTEGLSLTIVGDTGLSFTEADYLYTPGFTLQLEVAGVSGEGVTTGSIGGTWTAADGIITTTVGDNSLSTIVTINGVTQDASSTIGAIIASDPINEAPFDCTDPSAPVLQFDTGSGRVPVALSAAG
jgi:hypothetical protein